MTDCVLIVDDDRNITILEKARRSRNEDIDR